jgi:hypothetical protein
MAQRPKQAAMMRAAAMGPGSAQAQRARETSPLLPRTGGSAARPAAAAKSPSRSSSSSSAAAAAKKPAPRTAPQPPAPPRGAMRTAKPAQFGL